MRPEYDHQCVNLTNQEFGERCFAAIHEDNLIAQLTLLVELYWNAESEQKRLALFESACRSCGTDAKAIAKIALKNYI